MISTAAFLEGYYAQDSPMYGPERRGAPVASFVRISTEPIEERGYIASPDAVVLLDPSLAEFPSVDPLGGLPENCVVICNSLRGQGTRTNRNSVSLDVTGLARQLVGRDNVSAGMAAVTCKALGLARIENLVEAVRVEAGSIGLNEDLTARNLDLARECFAMTPQMVTMQTQERREPQLSRLVELRYVEPGSSTAEIRATGNTYQKKMGLWRTSSPVIDYSRCTKCMVCFVYCPDSCITLESDLTPRIDLENCKGCMVCAVECPLKAIREEVVR